MYVKAEGRPDTFQQLERSVAGAEDAAEEGEEGEGSQTFVISGCPTSEHPLHFRRIKK